MIHSDPIAVITVGGKKGEFATSAAFTTWCKDFFELQMIFTVEPIFVDSSGSSHQFRAMQQVARRIHREWNRFHGFVVHVPDQDFLLQADLLAFMLGTVGKPVIVMAASATAGEQNESGDYTPSALRASLLNAAQAATSEFGGVALLSSEHVVPVVLSVNSDAGIVQSATKQYIGRVDFGVQIANPSFPRIDTKPVVNTAIGEAVPVIDIDTLNHSSSSSFGGAEGIIVTSSDPLPLSVTSSLPQDVPVLLVSRNGIHAYDHGQLASIDQLTPCAAQAKFIWVVGQMKSDTPILKEHSLTQWMFHDFTHEILPPML